MVFVQGLALVPTAYLFLAPAFANMDPSLEEAAMTAGAGTWTLIRRVMMPILWPSILSAAIFLLIVSLVVFDVPGALGIPARIFVLSSQIYYLVARQPGRHSALWPGQRAGHAVSRYSARTGLRLSSADAQRGSATAP